VAKNNGSTLADNLQRSRVDGAPGIFSRLRYSPFLAQLVIIRRCNLSCSYCSEYDKVSEPVPMEVLEERLRKLKSLGTFGISLTGGEPTLHEAGLQEMQISIDGVQANDTTQKVLANLKKRLQWLREYARFRVIVSGVLGACPPGEAEEVVSFARQMGFVPRVLLLHDSNGQLKPSNGEVKTFEKIVRQLPKTLVDFSNYRKRLVRRGSAPFKCRAGSRYLYVDEFGKVNWCSQTRSVWSKDLMDYTRTDLREQFYQYKPCHATCTLGCARSTSQLDNWRSQPGFNS